MSAHPFDVLSLAELRQRTSIKWRTAPPDALPSFVAEMDYPVADPIRARLRQVIDRSDLGYTPYDPRVQVGEALAEYAQASWGWTVDPQRTVVLADVMRGIELSLSTFAEPGDQVVLNTPIYPPFIDAVRDSGRTIVESPLVWRDGRPSLDLADLAAKYAAGARIHLLCHPHNPAGLVLTATELARVVELAERYGVLVVSDEVHAPLTYPGVDFAPILTLPGADRVAVTVTSASKAWNIPGLKTAVVVAPDPARHQALLDLPVRTRMGASILGVHANIAAWTEGGAWLADVLGYLDGQRTYLAELLATALPDAGYAVPEATYLGWLDLRSTELTDPAERILEHGRVAVSNGADFGAPGVGWVRLNFATSRALLEEQVQRMAKALRTT